MRVRWAMVLVLGACTEHGSRPADAPPMVGCAAMLVPDRTMHDYGSSTGATAAQLTINNICTGPSGLPTALISGPHAGSFSITNNGCSGPIAGGGACALTVVFAPQTAGTKTATLDVSATPGGTATIELTAVALTDPNGFFTGNPSSLLFADRAVGTSSAPQTVTISNAGGMTSAPLTVQLAGTNPTAYQLATTCTGSLAPGGQCTVDVTFRPVALGGQDAILDVHAEPGGQAMIALSGHGL